MKAADIDQLVRGHTLAGYSLRSAGGQVLTLNDQAYALVTELLRLARLGTMVEEQLLVDHRATARTLAASADIQWRRVTGAAG